MHPGGTTVRPVWAVEFRVGATWKRNLAVLPLAAVVAPFLPRHVC